MPFVPNGKEFLVLILAIAVTLFDGLALAGGTPQIKNIYIVQLSSGDRIGFFATCRMSGDSCIQIISERASSPAGALHGALAVRYFLVMGAVLFSFITVTMTTYVFSGRRIEEGIQFRRFFKPIAVLSLMLHGGAGLAISTLVRALQDSTVHGVAVVHSSSLVEVFLWVAFGIIFLAMFVILRLNGIFGPGGYEGLA